MSKDIVKTSKLIKGMTSNVRAHFDVFDHARDIFLGQIKRAEAEYFDRIRKATAILAGDEVGPTTDNATGASPDHQPAA